jgi:ABC-type multidrug transport system fused ATPase/permease subunit
MFLAGSDQSFPEALNLGASFLLLAVLLVMGLTPSPGKVHHKGDRPVSPWDNCSPLSRATFMFTMPLMFDSHKKPLQAADLPDIPEADWPIHRFRRFMGLWRQKLKADKDKLTANGRSNDKSKVRHPSLMAVMATVFGCDLFWSLPTWLGGFIGEQSIPWLLNLILYTIEKNDKASEAQLGGICVLFGGAYMLQSLMYKRCWIRLVSISSQASYMLRSAVFQKMLRMAPHSQLEHSSGMILNLASSDISAIAWNVPMIMWSLIDTASSLVLLPLFLYHLVGPAFLYGFLMWIVIAPLSIWTGRRLLQAVKDKMRCGDDRLKLSSEVLDAMSTVKLLAWDQQMEARVMARRAAECVVWRRIMLLNWLMSTMTVSLPLMLGPLTLVCYTAALPGHRPASLSASFTALSFLWSLQSSLQNIKNVYTQILTTQASFYRIEIFMACEEYTPGPTLPASDDCAVRIDDAAIGYLVTEKEKVQRGTSANHLEPMEELPRREGEEGEEGGGRGQTSGGGAPETTPDVASGMYKCLVFRNLSLAIPRGKLVVVTGTVGSGKSTLLAAVAAAPAVAVFSGRVARAALQWSGQISAEGKP